MGSLSKTAVQLQKHYDTLITGDVHPVDHPVAKGDAREHGWRELLRRFLPDRYGVKSGFVIDVSGTLSGQIDCLIYRKDIGIELYSVGHHTVIPAEAVFGAFEVKPLIDAGTLKYAHEKAETISKLTLSNYFIVDQSTGERTEELGLESGKGSIITGLLADKNKAKGKWQVKSFNNYLLQTMPLLSVFMTIEDGCVHTLDTGYPTKSYTHYEGDHAILNQLIRLAEGITKLEDARCLEVCCLSKYTGQLNQPKQKRI